MDISDIKSLIFVIITGVILLTGAAYGIMSAVAIGQMFAKNCSPVQVELYDSGEHTLLYVRDKNLDLDTLLHYPFCSYCKEPSDSLHVEESK